MSAATAFIYSDSYQGYNFSPWHPMQPVRLLLTAELIFAYGITDRPGCALLAPRLATDAELALVHAPEYIAMVRQVSEPGAGTGAAVGWGLGTGDNPVFPRMHEAAATIAGASLLGAEKIMAGELDHAFNVAGGLHHAQRDRASGFCVYNDVAVAIARLRQHHGARVAYIDIDAHHGDGVQNAFYDDPDVLTISLHESGRSLFPGTGFADETGAGAARGTAVNLPLAPGTTDEIFLAAFDELVPPLLGQFQPDIIVTQNGCDGHWDDPLTHLSLTLPGYRQLWQRQHNLAHDFSSGRWLATGGGGYQAFLVVPRAWTALMAEMAGVRLPEELPPQWRELCARHSGAPAPSYLSRDDQAPAADPALLEAARLAARDGVERIRELVFPFLGI
ncbi:MAG: acetoin utilization protein AcuC [Thermoleophilia bacterium]